MDKMVQNWTILWKKKKIIKKTVCYEWMIDKLQADHNLQGLYCHALVSLFPWRRCLSLLYAVKATMGGLNANLHISCWPPLVALTIFAEILIDSPIIIKESKLVQTPCWTPLVPLMHTVWCHNIGVVFLNSWLSEHYIACYYHSICTA